MPNIQFLENILGALRARRHANTIIRDCQQDMNHIKISTMVDDWPGEKLTPLALEFVVLLREGIEADDRNLRYPPTFREACFPKASNILNTGDGIESAARFSYGSHVLRSSVSNISCSEPKLTAINKKLPDHQSCEPGHGVDSIILHGTYDSNNIQEWQGFSYIDNRVAQACVMGTRASTLDLPNDALLGSEMAVLTLLLSTGRAQFVPTAAIISFTNTHARVIQACVVNKEDGPVIHINMRYNTPVSPDGHKVWMQMLQWGLWSYQKGDETDEECVDKPGTERDAATSER